MNQFELFFPRVTATVMPMAVPRHAAAVSPAVAAPAPAPWHAPAPARATRDVPFRFEDVEVEPRVTYTVRLADYAHPGADAAKVAEQRFRREIDRQLGADAVAALRAFQNASESSESDLSRSEIALAKRWAKAYDAARTAGFRDLGDTDEAFFDVRPV
ncbi:hypothetical protein VLK31_10435 [Variovorax sp. H27-G14]|uniref:hypothetical protein n=1 Tax=Variovorax sp. H27-G14 TaxID=3111914 RepID=UPI0038FC591A